MGSVQQFSGPPEDKAAEQLEHQRPTPLLLAHKRGKLHFAATLKSLDFHQSPRLGQASIK